MLFIGLDIGTGGCKASVINEAGQVIDFSYCEYSVDTPRPGYVEIDAHIVWTSVRQVLSTVACKDISAIAIASFGEAAVLLDGNDEVLSNSIFYSDIRGMDEIVDIEKAIDRFDVQRVTGMPINPMYTANKLLWIKKHQPELISKTKHIFLFGDYIAFMLTGERIIDYSLASRTMLFDITEKTWSKKVTGALDIDPNLFSQPVLSGTPIGYIKKSLAQEMGFANSIQVIAGGHDQVMAALGAGVVYKGEAVDGMGSAECITLVLEKDDITPQMYANNYCCEPSVFEDRYVTLAFNTSSGTAVKWYRDAIESERAAKYAKTKKSLYPVLDLECSPQIGSCYYLPYVAGSGTPFMDATTGGAFIGLRVSTKKPELYRAVLEGICYEMKYNIEVLEACGIPLVNAVAVGGGAESDVLMQIKANIWGREIQTLETMQAGTTGLALICGHAMGVFPSIEEAAKRIVRYGKAFFPQADMVEKYKSNMNVYRRIYDAVKNVYRGIQ